MAKVVDKRREREKKEKIFLGIAAGLLLLLLVIQLPKMMKSKSASPAATTAATTGATLTDTTSPTGTVPVGTLPVGTGSGAVIAPSDDYIAGPGQLANLQLFANSDPFSQGLSTGSASTPAAPTQPPAGTTTTSKKPSGNKKPIPPTSSVTTTTVAPVYLSAIIAVNGVPEGVNVAAGFPAASPVFDLKSIAASSVQVTVHGGQFSDGAPSLTIEKGQSVTLVNTADGSRYILQLVSVSKKVAELPTTTGTTTAAGPSPPVPPTTITSTTPSTTTTTGTTTTR